MSTPTDPFCQPVPNAHWCAGCSPDNCCGCRSADNVLNALSPPAAEPDDTACILSPGHMRTILLGAGYTVKPGESDLKPYVYAAARALIRDALAMQAQIPAPPDPAPAAFLYHYHGFTQLAGGAISHFNGTLTCPYPLSTSEHFVAARLEIARAGGIGHAPERLTIGSLTLLNPPH